MLPSLCNLHTSRKGASPKNNNLLDVPTEDVGVSWSEYQDSEKEVRDWQRGFADDYKSSRRYKHATGTELAKSINKLVSQDAMEYIIVTLGDILAGPNENPTFFYFQYKEGVEYTIRYFIQKAYTKQLFDRDNLPRTPNELGGTEYIQVRTSNPITFTIVKGEKAFILQALARASHAENVPSVPFAPSMYIDFNLWSLNGDVLESKPLKSAEFTNIFALSQDVTKTIIKEYISTLDAQMSDA